MCEAQSCQAKGMILKFLLEWQDFKSETIEHQPRKALVTTSLLVVGDCWVLFHLRTEMDGSRVAWRHSAGFRKVQEWCKWMSSGINQRWEREFGKYKGQYLCLTSGSRGQQKEEN